MQLLNLDRAKATQRAFVHNYCFAATRSALTPLFPVIHTNPYRLNQVQNDKRGSNLRPSGSIARIELVD